MSEPEFRVKISVRNNLLVRRREELGLTQREMARKVGITASQLSALETCRLDPIGAKGHWLPSALRVAEFHGLPPEMLFTEAHRAVKHHSAERVLTAGQVNWLLLSEPEQSPERVLHLKEEWDAAEQMMDTVLTPAEHKILKMRYGVDENDGEEMTVAEIARDWNLSRERINQFLEKAKEKLVKYRATTQKPPRP